MQQIKTWILMLVLVGIFMYVGNLVGGQSGMFIAFLMACGFNIFNYFFSDTLVLKQYKAVAADKNNAAQLYYIVSGLAQKAKLPMPKIYIIPEQVPNAFATGRNPNHAAVAVTEGLLKLMSPQELEGVLAHEMSHVRHYDILIGTMAAVFASAVAMVGNTVRYNGTSAGNNRRGILMLIFMPIAASIIRLAISRTREYKADAGAAELTEHPEWLISALTKLDGYARQYRMSNVTSQTAHMFIVNPFSGLRSSLASLFSTHPSTADRITQLQAFRKNR